MKQKSIYKYIIIFLIVTIFPCLILSQNTNKDFTIYMILWRGVTDAEKGFMDYLQNERKVKVQFVVRNCNRDKSKIDDFIKEIKTEKPDLVYTFGTTVTKSIAGTTDNIDTNSHVTSIPVVFNIVADPTGAKIVASLKSSGRKVTGTSHLVPYSVQLSTIKEIMTVDRLGIIFNPAESNSVSAVETLEHLAIEYIPTLIETSKFNNKILKNLSNQEEKTLIQSLYEESSNKKSFKLKRELNDTENAKVIKILQSIGYKNYELIEAPIPLNDKGKPILKELANTVKNLANKKPDLIYIPSDSFLISNSKKLVNEINNYKIPTFSATEEPIRKGGALFGLVSTYYNVGKFAGYKAEQILVEGKDPSTIPIETLKRFSFLLNIDTARKLNFYPPIETFKFAEVISNK